MLSIQAFCSDACSIEPNGILAEPSGIHAGRHHINLLLLDRDQFRFFDANFQDAQNFPDRAYRHDLAGILYLLCFYPVPKALLITVSVKFVRHLGDPFQTLFGILEFVKFLV